MYPNVCISTHDDADVAVVKKKIPQNLLIRWKRFGISKVHEISLSSSSIILWKMLSQDTTYAKAAFATRMKKHTLLEKNAEERKESESDDNDDDDDTAEENATDDEDDEEMEVVVSASTSVLPDVELVPLNFFQLKSWVLIIYEEEKFLGKVLAEVAGLSKCLNKPYSMTAQEFESDAIYYSKV